MCGETAVSHIYKENLKGCEGWRGCLEETMIAEINLKNNQNWNL